MIQNINIKYFNGRYNYLTFSIDFNENNEKFVTRIRDKNDSNLLIYS